MSNKRIYTKTAGVILAGGKSRRMSGQHKGSLLTNDGKTFTEHIASEMHRLTDSVYLSYGDTIEAETAGCAIIRDIYHDCGPVGGLHAALKAAASDGAEAVMTSACDMPFVKAELYVFLYNRLLSHGKTPDEQRSDDEYATVCEEGQIALAFDTFDGAVCMTGDRLHPLTAIYSVRAAAAFEEQIIKKNLRVRDALSRLNILYVDLKGTEYEHMLVNINTESDYEKYRAKSSFRTSV